MRAAHVSRTTDVLRFHGAAQSIARAKRRRALGVSKAYQLRAPVSAVKSPFFAGFNAAHRDDPVRRRCSSCGDARTPTAPTVCRRTMQSVRRPSAHADRAYAATIDSHNLLPAV